jgi:DNA adenine methylase
MSPTRRKLRPLIKCPGGKWYLARPIVRLLPPHQIYIEPFAGGLNVLLNKPRSVVEVVGDLDGDLIGLYRVLQADPAELARRLAALDYSPVTFAAAAVGEPADPIDAAVRCVIRKRWSRGGLERDLSNAKRKRGGRPGDENAWRTFLADELSRLVERLRGVEFRHAPALELIREFDGPDTTFYLDPTYLPSTRTALDTYRYEMSEADHAELLDVVVVCRGAVVLSGYANALYDRRLAGWQRYEIPIANHAGQGKTKERRVEVLWIKPA